MKKLFCILILIIVTASSLIYSAQAAQDTPVFSDSRGVYRVSYSGRSLSVTSFGTYDITADIGLEYDIHAVCAADDKVVMFNNDPLNDQLIVTVYDISSDSLDSFALNSRLVYTSTPCCCDRDFIYIGNENKLEQYTYNGAFKRSYAFPDYVTYIVAGYDAGIYAVCAKELYYISGGDKTLINGADASSPIIPLCDDIILTGNGRIQTITGGNVVNSVQTDVRADIGQACYIGGVMYYPSGSMINGYDSDTGERICSYQCGNNVKYLYADGDTVYALDSDMRLTSSPDRDSFTYTQSSDENSGSNSSDRGRIDPVDQIPDGMPAVTSDVYDVSYADYNISRIPAGTTVSTFKSEINCGDCKIKLYRGESAKTSGNVGTAMMADFTKGDSVLRFELSIIGDLTGEGSANSRDMNILLDYLIGSADFNGAYTLSADINNDGRIDVTDAAKLRHMY